MTDPTSRALELLGLLQSRPVWSGPELAERLGVTTRSVRRDMERLRDLGYPVQASPGVAGGYQLGSGSRMPPLLLNEDEATAVAVSLGLAAQASVEGLGENALRALTKLGPLLPARVRARVEDISAGVRHLGFGGDDVSAESLAVCSRAIRARVQVRFEYRARDGAESERRAEPHQLVVLGRRWYLMAFDLDRDDWRTFRLDRVRQLRASTFASVPRTAPDAEKFVRRAIAGPNQGDATIRLLMPHSEASKSLNSWFGQLTPDGEATLLRCSARGAEQTVVQLLLREVAFEVIEPQWLLERVRDLAARLGRSVPEDAMRVTDPD